MLNSTADLFLIENGQWKRIDDTVKIKPASYDDDFVHGLTKGEYRLAIKAPTTQLNAVSYTSSSKSKKVAYKKSKAKKIKLDGQTSNIYTTGEKTSRWYKISITSTKKKRILNLGKNTVSGGYKFTIYKKGKKKAIKPAAIRTAPIFLIPLLAIKIPPYILIWINNTLFHTFHLFSL